MKSDQYASSVSVREEAFICWRTSLMENEFIQCLMLSIRASSGIIKERQPGTTLMFFPFLIVE